MSDDINLITFIDSEYRELFKIPDGGNIRIAYPPGDDRGTVTLPCKYIGSHHTRIGNYDYHICEFAEKMERIGARYEPEVWPWGVKVVPISPGEEKFCTYNREEGNACVGHVAGEFGQQGDRFHSGWNNHKTRAEQDWAGVSPEFQADLHGAVYALRQSLLKDYHSMLVFCQSHPEAKLPDRSDLEHYGFKMDTGNNQYFILCCAEKTSYDSRFIIYAYDKAAPVLEQEKPSVMKQIRDAQKAPKPPRKAKAPDKKKDGAEL